MGLRRDTAARFSKMTLADDLREKGEAVLEELLRTQAEETLHIEFKSLSDNSGEQLTRPDRQLLAKAVCGMANAEGGTIVVGIRTKRLDNIDVASAKTPIGNCARLRNLLVATIPEILSPQHTKIEVFTVDDIEDASRGFVIIEVPGSDDRPHMSNVHHQYFRRGSDGTRLLEHAEIRELMLGARQGILDIRLHPRASTRSGLTFGVFLTAVIVNAGRIAVRAPYIKFESAGLTWRSASSDYQERNMVSGYGMYSTSSVIVHVADENLIAHLETGIALHVPGQNTAKGAIDHIVRENCDENLFSIGSWERLMQTRGMPVAGGEIDASGVYGGENALAKNFEFKLDKKAIFELMLPNPSVAFCPGPASASRGRARLCRCPL